MLITYTLLIFTILIKVNRSAKEFPRKYFSNDKSILPNALAVTHQNSEKKFPKHFYVVINSTFFCGCFFLKSQITVRPAQKQKKGKNDQSHKKLSRQDKICCLDFKAPLKKTEKRKEELKSEDAEIFLRMFRCVQSGELPKFS